MPTESENIDVAPGSKLKRDVHLLVLIHGMWGNPNHLSEVNRIIKEVKGRRKDVVQEGDIELEVLVAQKNSDDSTYDGIDWGGERIADEIEAKVSEIQSDGSKVTKFSVTGYSLGGLLARYVVGALHQRNFFINIRPVNFATFATPHIGLLRYPSLLSSLSLSLAPKLLSRTGEQFYGVDDWAESGRALLEVMADPEQVFYQALSMFPNITIFANAINDTTVPYATAAIDDFDPFKNRLKTGLIVEMDEKYPYLIKSYHIPESAPTKSRKPCLFACLKSLRPWQLLPAPLQFRFPYNVLTTALIPVLIPTFMAITLVRLILSSRSSRKRIRLLESDEEMIGKTLGRVLRRLKSMEKRLEEAVLEAAEEGTERKGGEGVKESEAPVMEFPKRKSVESGRERSLDLDADLESGLASDASSASSDVGKSRKSKSRKLRKFWRRRDNSKSDTKSTSSSSSLFSFKSCSSKSSQPPPSPSVSISSSEYKTQPLTDAQSQMIASLNALPQLRKELAYFENVRNSHAMIVCRDVKRLDFHRKGEGIVRRWAEEFEV